MFVSETLPPVKLDLDAYEAMLPMNWTRARIADTMHTFKQGTMLATLTLTDQPSQLRSERLVHRCTRGMGIRCGRTCPSTSTRRVAKCVIGLLCGAEVVHDLAPAYAPRHRWLSCES